MNHPRTQRPPIRTLYLLPHAHTDVGYSHDPLATLELHDRFLDRAIALCEQTRDFPEGARFRWTVEVFFSALHWWEHRDESHRQRLCDCLSRGEIEIGARHLNGTELYSPQDIDWESSELQRLVTATGHRPTTAIQNDVNGFPLAFAQSLAGAGVNALVMGLNTTMGHSPFPRCSAFHWDVGEGRRLLVWNGWIYNRIKSYCHLDHLATDLHDKLGSFLQGLPADHPYDFAMTSATIGDNVGPFPALPEQVRRFNQQHGDLQLRLATFSQFMQVARAQAVELPVYAGHWPDFWTFGLGAMPQLVGMVRRAQRRLRLVQAYRQLGWANQTGGTLTMDRARRALALACEHTYDSHNCSGEDCGTADAMRQKAQVAIEAATAETASMVLLRDHLTELASEHPAEPVAVLLANPHAWPVQGDYLSERKGLLNFATSRRPEHLFQFDREPTFEALARAGSFGQRHLVAPAQALASFPLVPLERAIAQPIAEDASPVCLQVDDASLRWNRREDNSGRLAWQPQHGVECFDSQHVFAPFALVEERPQGKFQIHGMADMDPTDAAWNPQLQFDRRCLAWPANARQRIESSSAALTLEATTGVLRRLSFELDARWPNTLRATAQLHLDADPSVRGLYFALPLHLPGEGDCEYWADNCGSWFRAETDQLPGTCNSFYQTHQGVAVSRGGRTLSIASPDVTLFQFGGFTFSQLPDQKLQRRRPFVAIWLYNNYWSTNFPSYSAGHFTARFLLQWNEGEFSPEVMDRLSSRWDFDYMTHPIA